MALKWLRRATNYPAGISAGGGDTGFSVIGQETILTKKCIDAAVTLWLPAGTCLLATVVLPDGDHPSTTGDWQIDRVTGGANAELAASAAETPKITAYSPMKQLLVDTEYTLTPTNNPDGVTHVGFKVVLPAIRK